MLLMVRCDPVDSLPFSSSAPSPSSPSSSLLSSSSLMGFGVYSVPELFEVCFVLFESVGL